MYITCVEHTKPKVGRRSKLQIKGKSEPIMQMNTWPKGYMSETEASQRKACYLKVRPLKQQLALNIIISLQIGRVSPRFCSIVSK